MASLDAQRYDYGMALWQRLGLTRLRRRLLAQVSGEVLEIGVGTGLNLPLYPSAVSPTALDRDVERLVRAAERNPAARLLAGDAQMLPFVDGRFDTVVATLVFCSIPNPSLALAEIRRVLRPDGRLLLLEHVRGNGAISRRFTDWLHPLWFALQGECHLNRETAETVAANDFQLEYGRRHGWGLLHLLVARPTPR